MLDSDRRSGGGAVSGFSARYLNCSHSKVVRVSLGIVPWEQASSIKLDQLEEMKWFSPAGEKHIGVLGKSLGIMEADASRV